MKKHFNNSKLDNNKAYEQYSQIKTPLEKHHFLYDLHNAEPDLFCQLVTAHLIEMMPIIYTPTVGEAIEKFTEDNCKPLGLVLSYPERDKMAALLESWPHRDIDLIIVTDGEGILGIGDQGIGGIKICIGKGMVYSLCADIHPHRILPIILDVGTNNETILNHRNYLGWQHARIEGDDYDNFIQQFVNAILEKFPRAILHWEDFGKTNALKNLTRYRKTICSFNDDIQGTGVVALSCILSALAKTNQNLIEQDIVIFGAGSAGTGIADQIAQAMQAQGLSQEEANSRLWLIGRNGLLLKNMTTLNEAQIPYAKNHKNMNLKEVIQNIKPSVLIGCSTVAGAFDDEIIKNMASFNEHPIIMPLSNPTRKSEAIPADIIRATNGRALIATGSPFDDVEFNGKNYPITQCNNAYVFPGIGLGAISCHAKEITDKMLMAASVALAELAPLNNGLLPPLRDIQQVTLKIATAVTKQND